MLFVTVSHLGGGWFLAFSEMVSAAFDTLWGEISKLSFITEVLIAVAMEWSTQSNIVFHVYLK
jgi:hypothetical protein